MNPFKQIILGILTILCVGQASSQDLLNLNVIHKVKEYFPGEQHTLMVNIENADSQSIELDMSLELPEKWELITLGSLGEIPSNQSKLVIGSFFIPANARADEFLSILVFKDKLGQIRKTKEFNILVAEKREINIYDLFVPQYVRSGDIIENVFQISNDGNVSENIIVKANGDIDGPIQYIIPPDSSVEIRVNQPTNARDVSIRTFNSGIVVESLSSGKIYRGNSITKSFPSKVTQKDPYFRYPIQAGLFHNIYSSQDLFYSTVSAEIIGNGYLDTAKNNYLEFILRGPNQQNLFRFGMNDQYSLTYRYKNKTRLFLGDHGYNVNRLGFNSRFGMGFRLDHRINKWNLSVFYSKPRLYSFNNEPMYGVKTTYDINPFLSVGFSTARSSSIGQYFNKPTNNSSNMMGNISVFEGVFNNKITQIRTEVSTSITPINTDFATDFNLSHKIKRFQYQGFATVAGPNYFGALNNSLRYGNSLTYTRMRWNLSAGQGFSKIHERKDNVFQGILPHFENYFAMIGLRVNKTHYLSIRADHREREDQQSNPKNYHYVEQGLNYRYKLSANKLSLIYSGRIAKTKNLLLENPDFRFSYGQYLNTTYRANSSFAIRGNFSYLMTNRYGLTNVNLAYVTYGGGLNYNYKSNIQLNLGYNSGFNPEESHLHRDFVNANLQINFLRNHQLEFRVNHYLNPGTDNEKEWLAYLSYRINIGVPVKKVLKLGGVDGQIVSDLTENELKNLRIISAGNIVKPTNNGQFELNNLPLGKNFIFLEQESLPVNLVSIKKMPLEIIVKEDKKTTIQIEIVKAGRLKGKISCLSNPKLDLSASLKLSNKDFTYYIDADEKGNFDLNNIVPASYKLRFIRINNPIEFNEADERYVINVSEGEQSELLISLSEVKRKVKFKSNNFKLGESK